MYIPPIPEKKSMGNKEDVFVEKRKYLLDQFLKGLCIYPYMASCPEV